MYFIYPPLLLFSLFGFRALSEFIGQKALHWQWVTAIILIAGLAYPLYFMVLYHPYEYTYFNILAGSRMSIIKQRFGLDTWGVSVKNGMEYIARTDPAKSIGVRVVGGYNKSWMLLDKHDRKRLVVSNVISPDYIIETYRYYPAQQVAGGKIVYSIQVGDTDILTVYKVKGN
jgi:hypothetical protein